MPDIEIRNLTKVYEESGNEIVAVDDVDLTIKDGEFVTLVGPSGCGKTTTLRCCVGAEKAHQRDDHVRRPRGDGTSLFRSVTSRCSSRTSRSTPHERPGEHGLRPLKITGFSREERIARVEEAAELLQITDQLEKMPADLSGGQQQRASRSADRSCATRRYSCSTSRCRTWTPSSRPNCGRSSRR